MKKVLLFGLLAGLIMLAVGMLTGSVFGILVPSLKSEYENQNLFRPWTDPLMLLMYVHPFIVGLLLAWIWNKTKSLFTQDAIWKKGLCFGFIYWLFTIPGMVISISSFPISLAMVSDWTVSNLIQAICAGFLFSKTIK